MRKHVMEKNVHIWKLLRSPFTLPTLTCKTHICDWEIIGKKIKSFPGEN
jgi:hypothetical protein